MVVKKPINGNNIQENMITKINLDIMKPIYEKTIENKNLDEILNLIR